MRHEDTYCAIFGQVTDKLTEKYSGEAIPNNFDFESECYRVLKQVAEREEVDVHLLGKHTFPDIMLEYKADGEKIGVEVKLHTSGDSWTTLGNSAYASTQASGLETIFLLFGNFEQRPPTFVIKPYAACITDIKLTHSPRYIIDMEATTDFLGEKIGVSFDQLRRMEERDRVTCVNTYIAETKYKELTAVSDKEQLIAKGFVLFPEFFSSCPWARYRRMSVWLFANNILCRNVRDFISASGKARIDAVGPEELPRIFTSLKNRASVFKEEIEKTPAIILKTAWNFVDETLTDIPDSAEDRVALWLNIASEQYGGGQKRIGATRHKFRETLEKILS